MFYLFFVYLSELSDGRSGKTVGALLIEKVECFLLVVASYFFFLNLDDDEGFTFAVI